MKTLLTIFCLVLTLSSFGQRKPEEAIKQIDLRMESSGTSLKNSAGLQAASLITTILGSTLVGVGAVQDDQVIVLGGALVTVMSIPLSIASISKLHKAGTQLVGDGKTMDLDGGPDISEDELEELRQRNEEELRKQKEEKKKNK